MLLHHLHYTTQLVLVRTSACDWLLVVCDEGTGAHKHQWVLVTAQHSSTAQQHSIAQRAQHSMAQHSVIVRRRPCKDIMLSAKGWL